MSRIKSAHSRKRSGKSIFAVIALMLAASALLGSAFAWHDFTQAKTNKFRGTTDADVTLHDEFDGVDKHVFVENTGDSTLYVRVRLDEFMQIGDNEPFGGSGVDVRDKSTWVTHTYGGESIADCGNASAVKSFHKYYKWKMIGEDKDYTPGVPGMVYTALTSGKVDWTDKTGAGHHTAPAALPVTMSEYLAAMAIRTKWVGVLAAVKAGPGFAALSKTDQDAAIAQAWTDEMTADVAANPGYAAILDRTDAGCWILDDDSAGAAAGAGWAYWSIPLAPEKATNLLLSKVEFNDASEPGDDWIYRIDVKLQAVTASDFAKWDSGAFSGYKISAGAAELISHWQA